ncbi:unnamed protein product [Vitrella brassicaformis CCMP3155]|uniref:Uncharacterized protein n=1 Tax=Vitrella brassicaformis (strain CCMP3155) TaxID=1169540 RepID=A0A0G4FLV0_VITBC|nr:unnamed protein product [Vitrella brassicaformis CCMP3155]|mmetsp:Transcript_40095/g.114248  ORF Transcript_40095/g.114248 Transcript_40095/m.114248 type:complete len:608 (-) Transcript_40095:3162-4985(-)|eukprot:CEM14988.1 unnamed protein product [Vitrella brassicaformis CCMP3155]
MFGGFGLRQLLYWENRLTRRLPRERGRGRGDESSDGSDADETPSERGRGRGTAGPQSNSVPPSSSGRQGMRLDELSADIIVYILGWVSRPAQKPLCICAQVCHRLHGVSVNEELWSGIFRERFARHLSPSATVRYLSPDPLVLPRRRPLRKRDRHDRRKDTGDQQQQDDHKAPRLLLPIPQRESSACGPPAPRTRTMSSDASTPCEGVRRRAGMPCTTSWRGKFAAKHTLERKWSRGVYDHKIKGSMDAKASVLDVSFAMSGALILAACRDGSLYLMCPHSGERVKRLTPPTTDPSTHPSATCCAHMLPTVPTTRMLDRLLENGEADHEEVQVMEWDAPPLVFAGFSDGRCIVWDLSRPSSANTSDNQIVRTLNCHPRGVSALALVPSNPMATRSHAHAHGTHIDGKLLSGGADGSCCLWSVGEAADGPLQRFHGHTASVEAVAPARDGNGVFFTASKDRLVRMYDWRVGGTRPVCEFPKHKDWVLCVEAHPTSPHLLRSTDKQVHLWDVRRPLQRLPLGPHDPLHRHRQLITGIRSDAFRCVSVSFDGAVKLSSQEDRSWRGGHGDDGGEVVSLTVCSDWVMSVDFDETQLVTGTVDGRVEIFTFT